MASADDTERLAELEAFVREVRDIAETMELLGSRWGGEIGAGVALYGAQLRARAEELARRQGKT